LPTALIETIRGFEGMDRARRKLTRPAGQLGIVTWQQMKEPEVECDYDEKRDEDAGGAPRYVPCKARHDSVAVSKRLHRLQRPIVGVCPVVDDSVRLVQPAS